MQTRLASSAFNLCNCIELCLEGPANYVLIFCNDMSCVKGAVSRFIRNVCCGVKALAFESWLQHSLVKKHYEDFLIFLCLRFLMLKK